MKKEQFVLITGAGKGLGKAFVCQCALMGFNLILMALPGENTEDLAQQIQNQYGVSVVVYTLDMTDELALAAALQEINEKFAVFFLINNAGVGGTANINNATLSDLNRIINVNIKAMVQVTSAILPNLQAANAAYILNVSSMAAFSPIAYKTVYPATKAFVASFSLGLREELKASNISVSIVYPGPIMTNSNVSKRILAQGFFARLGLINTDTIAQKAIDKCLKKRIKIIPGIWNQCSAKLLQWLPSQAAMHLISNSVKKELQYNF